MLYIKQHADGDNTTVTVMDTLTGEVISTRSDEPDYSDITAIIEDLASKPDTTFADINEAIENVTGGNVNELRDEYGISIKDNKLSFMGHTFPLDFSRVFGNLEGRDGAEKLLKFTEKLEQNPLEYAAPALVEWITANPTLEILDDGRIRGYRGLQSDMRSLHSGYAIVNGTEINDRVDNTPGNVIQFPREMSDHNTRHYCGIGLHVGTADYARGFGDRYVTVAFSPADVISPPSDASQHKIRVCEMEVLEEVTLGQMNDFAS